MESKLRLPGRKHKKRKFTTPATNIPDPGRQILGALIKFTSPVPRGTLNGISGTFESPEFRNSDKWRNNSRFLLLLPPPTVAAIVQEEGGSISPICRGRVFPIKVNQPSFETH
ncbi:hypothetical protein CEXT_527311 [Caerostris extrusa]|uniref:Uncharacterized protein n=1 Tax=Caerostris extrusa TaxID=172846 RepID=A0AAV4N239_CAEEX|nr:hypothetical protein CEXT_527311 [Caerostris extrusa]